MRCAKAVVVQGLVRARSDRLVQCAWEAVRLSIENLRMSGAEIRTVFAAVEQERLSIAHAALVEEPVGCKKSARY